MVSRDIDVVSNCKTYDCDDFDRTQPELEFTKELDTKVVDQNDGEEEDSHPDSRIDFIG